MNQITALTLIVPAGPLIWLSVLSSFLEFGNNLHLLFLPSL